MNSCTKFQSTNTIIVFILGGIFLSVLASHQVQAADIRSSQSGSWNDSATWGGASVPASGDAVSISAEHTVTISTGSYVAVNITINPGGTLQLDAASGPITLTIDSNQIITNAGWLIMKNGSAVNTITIKSSDTGSENKWFLRHDGTQNEGLFTLTDYLHFENVGFTTSLVGTKYLFTIDKRVYLDSYAYAEDFKFLINGAEAELVLSPGLMFEYTHSDASDPSPSWDYQGEIKVKRGTLTAVGTADDRITLRQIISGPEDTPVPGKTITNEIGSGQIININYCKFDDFARAIILRAFYASKGDHISIQNSEFYSSMEWTNPSVYCGATAINFFDVRGDEINPFEIKNNWIHRSDWEGILIWAAKNILVERNYLVNFRASDSSNAIWINASLHVNGCSSCSTEAENITLRENFIAGGNRSRPNEQIHNGGSLANDPAYHQETTGIFITGNGPEGYSEEWYSGLKNILIENNYFYNLDRFGIFAHHMQGTTVQNNIFCKNGIKSGNRDQSESRYGAAVYYVSPGWGNAFKNNTIVSNYYGLLFNYWWFPYGDYHEGDPAHSNIFNNNIIANNTRVGLAAVAGVFQSDVNNNILYDNIIANSSMALSSSNIVDDPDFIDPDAISGTVDSADSNTLTDEGNFFNKNLIGRKVVITDGTGIDQVRTIISNSADTIMVDSNWIYTPDSSSEYKILPDFKLSTSSSSPGIDNGLQDNTILTDIIGTARPQGLGYDIGAFECLPAVGIPTAIRLSSFTVKPQSRAVIVEWTTGDETDNLGFNIYRFDSRDGTNKKINDSLILSKVGSGLGTTYEFTDSNVKNRVTYFYTLEDVDVYGVKTMHGPVQAMPLLIYGIAQ